MEAALVHFPQCDPAAGCVSECPVRLDVVIARARRKRERKSGNRWSARASRLNKRASRVRAKGRVSGGKLRELVALYDSLCAYCGAELEFEHPTVASNDPRRASFDHVKPLGRGGGGGIENLVPACSGCNHKRSTWPDSALGVPAPRRFALET